MGRTFTYLVCFVLVTALALPTVAPAGLLGWWEFEEGSGTTAGDSSGNGNDGTLNGGAEWQTGMYGGGVYLDGVDDYIEIPDLITEAGTLSFWFKPDWDGSDPEDYRLFDASTSTIYFFVSKGANHADINPEEFGFYFEDASDADWQDIEFDPVGVISAGMWLHVLVTWEFGGGYAYVYINGEEAATTLNPLGELPVLYDNPRLGLQTVNYIPAANGAKGVIDDVRFYDRVLKEPQARDLFNGIAPTWTRAEEPNPADGAVGVATPLLTWGPGETAKFHNVYLGTSAELTEADLVAPRQPFAMYYHIPGLEPGGTYYWRVDEIESDLVTIHTGHVWSFTMMPLTAWGPSPADGGTDAFQAPTLSWSAGLGALEHHVYFGEDRDPVKDGAPEADQGPVAETTFSAGLLRAGTTYYWRVDGTDLAGQTQEGEVWSFTTGQPAEGQVVREWWLGISGTAVSALTGDPRYPGSPDGVEFVDLFEGPVDWLSSYGSRLYGWLIPSESGEYTFWIASDDNSELWLSTDADPANALVIASVLGWTPSRDFDNTGGGTGDADTQESDPVTLQAGQQYFIQALQKDGTGGDNIAVAWQPPGGTREVIPGEFVNTFALPPLKAAGPSPADGAVDVVQPLVLSWFAGENATQHEVYLGEDAEAVGSADTASPEYRGQQAATTYNPGALEWGKTFYWRIDEKEADGTVLTGAVWSFATANFIVVDDFESYDDADNRIYMTWIDGVENGTGSYVGYEVALNGTFGETVIVYGGGQSMPLDYNNVKPPSYSEADRTFGVPQDWTVNDVDALVLYVQGSAGNDAEPLYVAVEDTAGHIAVVEHPDPAIATAGGWNEWPIPLSDLAGAGVNLAAVKKMYIGLGNRDAPTPGGAGLIFIDEIRVTRP